MQTTAEKAPAKVSAPVGYNYQIDVLKLIFACAVVGAHTSKFNVEELPFPKGSTLGWVAVFFFFIVSGYLMVNSFMKKKNEAPADLGKSSVSFVIRKFKSIAVEYWTALFICLVVYIYLTGYWDILLFRAPEVLGVSEISTLTGSTNGPLWYISAMLLCMLPLYYMLQKNSSFFIYVFSPIAGLMIFGYLFSVDPCGGRNLEHGFIITTILKALAGLLCGVTAWAIADWLKKNADKTAFRVFLTICEVAMYVLFFYVFLFRSEKFGMVYSATLLLIPALAITFSQQSYINRLFRFRFFKFFGFLGTEIYFTHWTARIIIENKFTDIGFKDSLIYMALFTCVFIVIHVVVVIIVKKVWEKYLRKHFVNTENT
ncbi:MAG: acyltransferase [Oscillospiraceae bacterium]